MKTFVSDDYQIAIYDDGGFKCWLNGLTVNTIVEYNPSRKDGLYWSKCSHVYDYAMSESLTCLWLSTRQLRVLHEALEVANKQDLMDNEITFVK